MTPATIHSSSGKPAGVMGIPDIARVLGLSRQAVHSQIRRGVFPLQPFAQCADRLFYDRGQVERAAAILNPSKK